MFIDLLFANTEKQDATSKDVAKGNCPKMENIALSMDMHDHVWTKL